MIVEKIDVIVEILNIPASYSITKLNSMLVDAKIGRHK